MNKYKLLLIEECQLTSLGIKHALLMVDEIEMVEIVSSWQLAEQLINCVRPNIILLSHTILQEISTTDIGNFHSSYPHIKIVLIGSDFNGTCLQYMIKAGVHGLILKHELIDVITDVVHLVTQGGYYFGSSAINASSCPINTTIPFNNIKLLTPREKQIFDLAVSGLNAVQIAKHFNLSSQTIRNHLSSIYSKTNVQSQVELVV